MLSDLKIALGTKVYLKIQGVNELLHVEILDVRQDSVKCRMVQKPANQNGYLYVAPSHISFFST
jgi:hypothetical protein